MGKTALLDGPLCVWVGNAFWAYKFGHQTSSTIVSSHSKLKQHPAYEFGHQTSSTVVSSHSKLKQHPTNVAKQGYNENFRLWSPIKQTRVAFNWVTAQFDLA